MSARTLAFRPPSLTDAIRLLVFPLAVVVAVLVGLRTDSFWVGLLAFFVVEATGTVTRRLGRRCYADALYEALWPLGATGFLILFLRAGLPAWAAALVASIAAGAVQRGCGAVFLPTRAQA